MRLDKFICHNLNLTRTQAKSIIKKGEITVDGAVITNPSTHISPAAEVIYQEEAIHNIGNEYFMLHKPKGFVSTNKEGLHPMIFDLLDLMKPEDYHAAGRLDLDTTGLVLVTNDGQWSHRVTSPSRACGKVYLVELAKDISDEDIKQIEEGILLKGERKITKPAKVEKVYENEVRLTIFEGKYHQVKRMFSALDNNVEGLHREKIGEITLDPDLGEGEYRPLTQEEIDSIK